MQIGESDENGRDLARGVAIVVLLGIALGLAFNALQLASGPRRGLAWIRHEAKLASLESVAGAAEAAPIDSSTHAPAAAAESTAAQPAGDAPADSVHAHASSKTGAAATHAKPGGPTPRAANPRGASSASTPPVPATPAPPTPATAPAGAANVAAGLPVVPDTREPLEVQYATIKKFWDAGAALFVDARTADEYAGGHIPGAVNLPFDDVFRDPDKAKSLDTRGRAIVITYCGGGECDLSRNLAFSLIDAGQKKVLIFLGGTTGWKEGGNPLLPGKSPGPAPGTAQ